MFNNSKQHAFTLIELVTVLSLMVCCLYFFSQKFITKSGKNVKTSTALCETIINSARWHAINHHENTYFFIDTSPNEKNFCKRIGFFTKNLSTNEIHIKQDLTLPENNIIIHPNFFSQISQINIDNNDFENFNLESETTTTEPILYNSNLSDYFYMQIDQTGTFIDNLGNKKNSLLIFASGKYISHNSIIDLQNINTSDGIRPIVILNNGKVLHITLQELSNIADEI